MRIAIFLYPGMTALDAIGPYEVLSRLPDVEIAFTGLQRGTITVDSGFLSLVADHAIDEVETADILVVPGGPDVRAQCGNPQVVDWIRKIHATTQWTTSVCTGALILGAAGLLEGLAATSHWLARDELVNFGATPTPARVVEAGKIVTAAGVSAGIDMALTLMARIAGKTQAQATQLLIEYDPQPPFHAGSPETAPKTVVEALRAEFAARLASSDGV